MIQANNEEKTHTYDEHVWYFTFGANMNAKTLASRGISPSQSIVGTLPSYYMAFTYDGYDLVEPRFTNIEPILTPGDADADTADGVFEVEGKTCIIHIYVHTHVLLLHLNIDTAT
jgi:hypothetical protein